MVYLDAANNLESFGMSDFSELQNAVIENGESDKVLILFDRIADSADGIDDWDETRLYEIGWKDGKSVLTELNAPELGLSTDYIDDELDMGNPDTLSGFINYVKAKYPAQRYFLDLWDHGGGWRSKSIRSREICVDDESGSVLYMMQIRKALEKCGDIHFTTVILDACSMATVEVAATFLGYTNSIVFSQMPVPCDGMPYNMLLPLIFSGETTKKICQNICEEYVKYYKNVANVADFSISAFAVDENNLLAKFIKKIDDCVDNLDQNTIKVKRDSAQLFVETTVDMSVLLCISELQLAFENTRYFSYPESLSGMSIYFPEYFAYDRYGDFYNADSVYFLSLCNWDLFLSQYNSSGITNVDTYEPNGSESKAAQLSGNCTIQSYLWCKDDKDFFVIPVAGKNSLSVNMIPPLGHDFDIKIYWYEGTEQKVKTSHNMSDLQESITFTADELLTIDRIWIIVWSPYAEFSQTDIYNLTIQNN